jgi:hypothetical protein
MSKRWARETRDGIQDFNMDRDLLLAIMIYGDKTGTDVNQMYSLEPWMFTILLLCQHAWESLESWRHLGFIPSLDFVDSLSSKEKLQLYHDYMSVLLHDFKSVCTAKPVMWVNLGGVWERRWLHIKLCLVSGNQKSQD